MESPDHERRHVIEYVEGQASDETVEHAEKIASERVLGELHDVWDVHTDKSRWWVVTGMTNLYSQDDFKSMDYVLSFHVGLMARMLDRQHRQAPERPVPRLLRTRRQWEQAAEAQNAADETEEFQAVGMRCREALISYAHAMATDELLEDGSERPKASDFVHWAELVADAAVPGARNKDFRAYLKALAKRTWDYVNWLTHAKHANRFDGDVAVEITGHVLWMFEEAVHHAELGVPARCPRCESFRVGADWRLNEDDDTVVNAQVCTACGWYEERSPEPLRRRSEPELPVGPCVTADGNVTHN